MDWIWNNWTWFAAMGGLYLLLDIAGTLRSILTELRRPEDERAAWRIKHGTE